MAHPYSGQWTATITVIGFEFLFSITPILQTPRFRSDRARCQIKIELIRL